MDPTASLLPRWTRVALAGAGVGFGLPVISLASSDPAHADDGASTPLGNVTSLAGGTVDTAADTVGDATGTAADAVGAVVGAATEVVQPVVADVVKPVVQETVEAVSQIPVVGDVAAEVGVDEAVEDVVDLTEGVAEDAAGIVDDTGEAIVSTTPDASPAPLPPLTPSDVVAPVDHMTPSVSAHAPASPSPPASADAPGPSALEPPVAVGGIRLGRDLRRAAHPARDVAPRAVAHSPAADRSAHRHVRSSAARRGLPGRTRGRRTHGLRAGPHGDRRPVSDRRPPGRAPLPHASGRDRTARPGRRAGRLRRLTSRRRLCAGGPASARSRASLDHSQRGTS